MSMPFYVSPEQMMKDKAEYARKGISRGRSIVTLEIRDGILLVAENPSTLLHKVSEIYDRIAFAGVGRYNEFDQLRVAGVRAADLKGFQYSRDDVDARSLANQYAQILGQIFTHEMKPLEVEILVAEVGPNVADDQLYHVLYDGTVFDEDPLTVLGGEAEEGEAAGAQLGLGDHPRATLMPERRQQQRPRAGIDLQDEVVIRSKVRVDRAQCDLQGLLVVRHGSWSLNDTAKRGAARAAPARGCGTGAGVRSQRGEHPHDLAEDLHVLGEDRLERVVLRLQPDAALVGGITGLRRVALMWWPTMACRPKVPSRWRNSRPSKSWRALRC